MKKQFLSMLCGLLACSAFAVPKYWVGSSASNWNKASRGGFEKILNVSEKLLVFIV